MMQLLPIILVAVVMAVAGGVQPLGSNLHILEWAIWIDLGLVPLGLVAMAWAAVTMCVRRLRRGRVPGPLIAAERIVRATRWLIVANHCCAVLVLGALRAVRSLTGDLILIDEFIVILPALLALLMLWWAYYPIDRLLVESSLIRRLDSGAPVYPTLSRAQYVAVQARINLLLLLVPVLMIAGLSEAVELMWSRWDPGPAGMREALTVVIAALVFLLAPLLARLVLDTESMPSGPMRESLSEVCRRHRVGVRDLLLWKTNGSMINAAVMGLVAPLRYVLITDALLETLHDSEVRAVMAHEVGHVRRRHMVWMVLCVIACVLLAAHLVYWPLWLADCLWRLPPTWQQGVGIASATAQLGLIVVMFGWISRRFERQADTFASQHLSGLGTPLEATACVSIESVDAMRSALESIAELNAADPARHSWRHGSIRWRQEYLGTIIGRPLLSLPIDRLIRRVKLAVLVVLVLGISFEIVAPQSTSETPNDSITAKSPALQMPPARRVSR